MSIDAIPFLLLEINLRLRDNMLIPFKSMKVQVEVGLLLRP